MHNTKKQLNKLDWKKQINKIVIIKTNKYEKKQKINLKYSDTVTLKKKRNEDVIGYNVNNSDMRMSI